MRRQCVKRNCYHKYTIGIQDETGLSFRDRGSDVIRFDGQQLLLAFALLSGLGFVLHRLLGVEPHGEGDEGDGDDHHALDLDSEEEAGDDSGDDELDGAREGLEDGVEVLEEKAGGDAGDAVVDSDGEDAGVEDGGDGGGRDSCEEGPVVGHEEEIHEDAVAVHEAVLDVDVNASAGVLEEELVVDAGEAGAEDLDEHEEEVAVEADGDGGEVVQLHLLDHAAEGEDDECEPLPGREAFGEEELEDDAGGDGAEVEEEEVGGGIEVGEVDEGEVVVEAVEKGGYDVECEELEVGSDLAQEGG